MQRTTLVTISLLPTALESAEAKLQRASSCVVKRGAVILVDVHVLGRRVDLEQPAQTFVCKQDVREVAISGETKTRHTKRVVVLVHKVFQLPSGAGRRLVAPSLALFILFVQKVRKHFR